MIIKLQYRLLVLLIAGCAWQPCFAHRYLALLDFPGTSLARCAVLSDDPRAGQASIKIELDSLGKQVVAQRHYACSESGWLLQQETTTNLPLALNQALDGFDQLSFALPRSALPDAPSLTARVLSLDNSGQWQDEASPGPGASLAIAGNALGVPVLKPVLALTLLIAVLLIGARQLGATARTRAVAALAMLGSLGIGFGSTGHAERSVAPTRLDWQDQGYDFAGSSAAVDLRRGALFLAGRELQVEIAVNNIEPALLSDQDRMLFIGNSLTGTNDVPGLLRKLAAQAGKQLDARAQIIGGSSLEDHLRGGNATREIAAGHYPVVSLQQGPSSLQESQLNLRTWTQRFNPYIRNAGGRPLLYMVWPDRSRISFFSDVFDSYRNAALAVDGAFAPAGNTWLEAWAVQPELAFYGSDDFHPTLLGSYVAALSLFCAVYQQSPEGLPAYIEQSNGNRTALAPETARFLQQTAWRVYREQGLRGLPES